MGGGVRAGAWLAGCLAVTGCGEFNPEEDCIEEFVQEYQVEYLTDVRRKPCSDVELSGPPEFPRNLGVARIEYSGGNYFIAYTLQEWVYDSTSASIRGCSEPRLEETLIRIASFGGREQAVVVRDGRSLTEREIREMPTPSMILFGHHASPAATGPFVKSDIHETDFGISCATLSRSISSLSREPGEACMPLSPVPRCPAFDRMAPITAESSRHDARRVSIRTTAFRSGAKGSTVDTATWAVAP